MLKYINLIFFICYIIPSICYGGVIRGKVTDKQGEILPYAIIHLEGTTIGTNANGDGLFELSIEPGVRNIICQYIGYKQENFIITINSNEIVEHNFILKSESLEMKEVVISSKAEDPAYRVIRKTIEKRIEHLEQIKSFQTSIFMKVVMRTRQSPHQVLGKKITPSDLGLADTTGKGILYLLEEDADYYAQDGENHTVIHSVKESGNPGGVGFSRFPPVITFYDNVVNIFGRTSRGYISPVGENALNYYTYKLLGEFKDHGHNIYKIQVIQKRDFEPCFNGTIYIVDTEFAIHSMNLTLTKQSGLDKLDTLRVEQLYLPFKDNIWVIKSQVQYFALNILGFDIAASRVTVYNNQKINQTIPDSFLKSNITSVYDKVANKKDTTYWNASRPIPLENDEIRDYIVKDSIRIIEEDPARLDSLRRRGNKFKWTSFALTSLTYKSKEAKNTYSLNPLLMGLFTDNIINFNPVEGFNVAPKVKWKHVIDSQQYITTDAAVRYGFANKHLNAIARFTYTSNNKEWIGRNWIAGIEAGRYVFQYNSDNPVLQWFNTYASLFYRENDLRLYERTDFSAFLRRDYGNGLDWLIKSSFQHRSPLNNTTNFSIFEKPGDVYKTNTPLKLLAESTNWEAHNAAIIYSSISFKPGFTYTQYPDYKIANNSTWPRLTLTYEKAIAGIFNSKSDYDKVRFAIHDKVQLRLLGNLSYNFVVGGFLSHKYVAIPDLMHLYGNRGVGYAAPYLNSFQFAQYYDFSNQENIYGEAHVEYHLNGLLSNKIPLLKQMQWYLLVGGNVFYANKNEYYSEAFIGIDNIGWKVLRLLRIDFVQSWDSFKGHNSGIRFGLSGRSVSVTKNNPTHNEW